MIDGFNCTSCGMCCRLIRESVESAIDVYKECGDTIPIITAITKFPFGWDEDGCCEKLDKETNLCTIYEDRPLVCNVERVWETYYKDTPQEEYIDIIHAECKRLQSIKTLNDNTQ